MGSIAISLTTVALFVVAAYVFVRAFKVRRLEEYVAKVGGGSPEPEPHEGEVAEQ